MSLVKRRNLFNQRFSRITTRLFQHAFSAAMQEAMNAFTPGTFPDIDTGMSAASFLAIMQNKDVFDIVQQDFDAYIAYIKEKRARESNYTVRDEYGFIIDRKGKYSMDTGLERGALNPPPEILKGQYKTAISLKYAIKVHQWKLYEDDWRVFDTFFRAFRTYISQHVEEYFTDDDLLNTILGKP